MWWMESFTNSVPMHIFIMCVPKCLSCMGLKSSNFVACGFICHFRINSVPITNQINYWCKSVLSKGLRRAGRGANVLSPYHISTYLFYAQEPSRGNTPRCTSLHVYRGSPEHVFTWACVHLSMCSAWAKVPHTQHQHDAPRQGYQASGYYKQGIGGVSIKHFILSLGWCWPRPV